MTEKQNPTDHEQDNPFAGKFQKWLKGLSWLYASHPSVQDIGESRRAQLLNIVTLILTISFVLGLLSRPSAASPFIFMLSLSLMSFVLGKTKYYKAGSSLFVFGFLSTAYVSLLFGIAGNYETIIFSIVPVALIVASALVGQREFLFVVIYATLATFLAPYYSSTPTLNVLRTGGIVTTIGAILYGINVFRTNIERARLQEIQEVNRQLTGAQISLEKRVADRTHDMELAAEVGRTITEKVGNMYDMLTEATEMIRARFNLYYTQVYLLDPSGRNLTLRAGTGDVGQQLLRRGHHLLINSGSLNGRAVTEKKPVIVTDTAKSGTFLRNPLLPNTRSEMVVPLIVSGRVLGALDMQSETPDALNETNLPAFETLAGQLSVAIQNASLFAESEEARKQVEANIRQMTETGWKDFLNGIERSERIGFVFNQMEVTPLENANATQSTNALSAPITVTGATVGKIYVAEEEERDWTSNEAEIVQATAVQLAQHIESLRLLAQSEKYRQEAEQVTRRLTREGWETYLQTRNETTTGFTYDLKEIKLLNENLNGKNGTGQKKSLMVRNEVIGEIEISEPQISAGEETNELVANVAARLSEHIESLRLAEQTQRALIETEQLSRQNELILDSAGEGLFGLDANGNHTFVNPAAAELLGYTVEELIGKHSHSTWHHTKPDGTPYPSDECPIYDAIHSNRTRQGDEVFIRKDGTKISVAFTATPVSEGGQVVGAVVSFLDITQRQRDQAVIAQRAVQLETVATVSSTASTVLDPDKLLQAVVDLTKERFGLYHAHIYLADEAWQTLLLASGAGEVGRKMVAQEHAIAMDAEKSLVARAARERQAVIINDVRNEPGFLPNILLPDTRSEMAVPMIVGDKVLGVFDVQSDQLDDFLKGDADVYTTLAAQVAVALQNARLYVEQAATLTQLRELDRLKSSFLANMSHELRTPLNSILGFADVMLEGLDGPITENMGNDLGLIHKNGQHLLHLINDVLDMAKIEAGRMNLNPEKFRLHELIDEVTSLTSTFASEKSLALFIEEGSDENLEIFADRTRMRQVMINLVNNAIKFTEKGKIAINAIRRDDHVLISVRDTGVGIPPDKLEAVFQEFIQVDTSSTRKVGGTGLGLPISRRLVEMQGGRLWAESSGIDGEGTTFYVDLPLEAVIAEPEKLEK